MKKIIQSGGFLGKLLSKLVGPLMKVALPLAKNVLAPLGLTAAMLKGKKLLDYTKLFSPNDFKKNDQVIKRIFKNE